MDIALQRLTYKTNSLPQQWSTREVLAHSWLGLLHAHSKARAGTEMLNVAQGAKPAARDCIHRLGPAFAPRSITWTLLLSQAWCSFRSSQLPVTDPWRVSLTQRAGKVPTKEPLPATAPSIPLSLSCQAQEWCQADDICRDVHSPSTPAPRQRKKTLFFSHEE